MQTVGSGFQTHVDYRSRLPAIVCRWVLLQVEFLNRVDGENGGGIARDSGTVDDGLSGVGLAVEQTFDEVGIVLGAQTVAAGGRETAARIAHYTGPELKQVLIVAAVQRQVVNFLIAQ